MLVLTRKSGESIWIGDDIEVKIIKMGGGQARIGVNAPDDVVILRGELRERADLPSPGTIQAALAKARSNR